MEPGSEGAFADLKQQRQSPSCRTTGQTELGGDGGDLICIFIPERLKHAERSSFIACLAFVLGERSKTLLDPFIHVPLHPSQLSSATEMCSQDSAAGGVIPGVLPVGLGPILLPQPGALGADAQKLKLLITLVSAPTLTFGGVST